MGSASISSYETRPYSICGSIVQLAQGRIIERSMLSCLVLLGALLDVSITYVGLTQFPDFFVEGNRFALYLMDAYGMFFGLWVAQFCLALVVACAAYFFYWSRLVRVTIYIITAVRFLAVFSNLRLVYLACQSW